MPHSDSSRQSAVYVFSIHTGEWTEEDAIEAKVNSRLAAPDSKYSRGALLGSGGFANVYKVLRDSDKRRFAGKSSEALDILREEGSILRSLEHDHILKFIDWHEDLVQPSQTLLITELCTGGSLKTKIDNSSDGFSREVLLRTVLQISEALQYLHEKNLFHCDVKPRNILVRTWDPVDVVLADCADVTSHKAPNQPGGTPEFWSPQLVQRSQRRDGPKDDIWALGISMLAMMAQSPVKVFTKAGIRKHPQMCFEHAQDLKKLNPGHDVVELLNRMLTWEPRQRASAAECVRLAKEALAANASGEMVQQQQQQQSGMNPLGLKIPRGFQAHSFW